MPSPYHLDRGYAAYVSDDGNTYNIGTTNDNIDANSATAVAADANPAYPRGFVMRHVYGVASTGKRTKLPILDPTNELWTTGTTFSKNAVSYDVQGRIGEKRTRKGG